MIPASFLHQFIISLASFLHHYGVIPSAFWHNTSMILAPLQRNSSIASTSFWRHCSIILASVYHQSGAISTSFWCNFKSVQASFRPHCGIIPIALWHHSSIIPVVLRFCTAPRSLMLFWLLQQGKYVIPQFALGMRCSDVAKPIPQQAKTKNASILQKTCDTQLAAWTRNSKDLEETLAKTFSTHHS